MLYGKWWLAPIVPPLLAPLALAGRRRSDPAFALILIAAGVTGLGAVLLQGFAIGLRGWQFGVLEAAFGPLDDRQFGMGYGGLLVSAAFLFFLTRGIAARGAINGDVFVVGSIGLIIALVTVFIFFPVTQILISAAQDNAGAFAPGLSSSSCSTTRSGGSPACTAGSAAAWPGTRCSSRSWSAPARRCSASPSR